VTDSAAAFSSAARAVPEEGWRVPMQVMNFPEFPASELLTRRLVELELHHTDLGAGYGPADWPAASRPWACPSR
jgi:maleylpyruvate isomerase